MLVCIHALLLERPGKQVHIQTHRHTHIHTHKHTHTHVHTHIHKHKHTHIHAYITVKIAQVNSGGMKTFKYVKISMLNFFTITILSLHSIFSESKSTVY